MTILVTGASGLIGSHLCAELIRQHYDIVTLTRSTESQEHALSQHTYTCDIRDAKETNRIVNIIKPSTIFHMAACCRPSHKPTEIVETNIEGTAYLLDAAKSAGVSDFVFASSMSVYTEPPQYLPVNEEHSTRPISPYGVSKVTGEWLCQSYQNDIRVRILRYASVYGNGDRERVVKLFMDAALSCAPLHIQGDGRQSSDFIYVKDAVDGTLRAWRRRNNAIYNIGSGRETTITELAETIIRVTGSLSEIVYTGKSNKPFRFVSDISKAQDNLGYSPSGLEEGLKAYYRDLTV
jgi:UDP-glucose 4-epimerase